ncbi:hypothetical protein K470DRAFT_261861 [Piedraia hortae CBS 480.64]|uniref:F-box domain-containing protein n=1 Tax=Piedraia hortae CBS 480.64 TaxID=1314780 RepID=A0A6A7C8R0_9PEZI|nr:hypothetical protein K470DRAFT_261861 [Piedraia hortae CBS 480.64]
MEWVEILFPLLPEKYPQFEQLYILNFPSQHELTAEDLVHVLAQFEHLVSFTINYVSSGAMRLDANSALSMMISCPKLRTLKLPNCLDVAMLQAPSMLNPNLFSNVESPGMWLTMDVMPFVPKPSQPRAGGFKLPRRRAQLPQLHKAAARAENRVPQVCLLQPRGHRLVVRHEVAQTS